MIFALAYRNLAMARDAANAIDKTYLNFEDILIHFEKEEGDSKLLAAEMLVKNFGDQLGPEVLARISAIKQMRLNPDFLSIILSKEDVKDLAIRNLMKTPVEALNFRALVELCNTEEIMELVTNA